MYAISKHPKDIPFMIFAKPDGDIEEHPYLRCTGRSGTEILDLKPEDFIELPEGSEFFLLPDRFPYGFNPETGKIELFEEGNAISAFVAPAYTQTYMSAYASAPGAQVLPLYAYTAIGWLDGKFYTTALRIDPDIRQDVPQFFMPAVEMGIEGIRKRYPQNRLIDHLSNNCALNYHCRAAQNYFLGRWECPLPTSPACNAECLGCISLQPEEHDIQSAHFRLKFTPSPQEIAEIAYDHIESAPEPIVSFGQGCEGEPLLVWETIEPAIKAIRAKTDKGIINMNTNGSRPEIVDRLCKAGMQSIRVSTNSAQEAWYKPYYLPRNYQFRHIIESLKVVKGHGGWTSINYFTFPGLTDSEEEYEALRKLIIETDLDMIQWRNFNIDPDWYLRRAKIERKGAGFGIKELMDRIMQEFPHMAFGYFNPAEHTQAKYRALRTPVTG